LTTATTSEKATPRTSQESPPPALSSNDTPAAAILARKLDKGQLIDNAELGGTVPMWRWIGDDGATTFGH
jgi:hypothetical protein